MLIKSLFTNRSVLCHKTVYEALECLRFEAFLDTLDYESQKHILLLTVDMKDSFNERIFHDNLESQSFKDLFHEYGKFIAKSSAESKTFAYWSMYMKMAGMELTLCFSSVDSNLLRFNNIFSMYFSFSGILLMFIRATREVDWELHLSTFRLMITWFFACDKINYARYGSAFWLEMVSLETTHPGLLYLNT